MSASAGLNAQFAADALEVAPGYAQATAAFRVAQEALNNVVRHAGAGKLAVELRRRGGELVVTVADDGWAFDLEAVLAGSVKGSSMGLLGMQERVNLTGGWLKIESADHPRSARASNLFCRISTVRAECPRRTSPTIPAAGARRH